MKIKNIKQILVMICLLTTLSVAAQVHQDAALEQGMTLFFNTGENWKVQMVYLVPAEQLPTDQAQIDSEMASYKSDIESQMGGVDAKVEVLKALADGSIPIRISLTGMGYHLLNDAFFNGEIIVQVDKSSKQRQILFALQPTEDEASNSFSIHGGSILSTNGKKTGNSIANWTNPTGLMTATLTEAGASSASASWQIPVIIALAGALVLVSAGWLLTALLRKKQPASIKTEPMAPWQPAIVKTEPETPQQPVVDETESETPQQE